MTSSFAPTYALPAPVERALAVLDEDSGAHTQLEEAVQTVPKLTDGSYFLRLSVAVERVQWTVKGARHTDMSEPS